MKRIYSILLVLLAVATGAFFIFSAWSKTTPNLQYFEYTIRTQVHLGETLSAWAARFFIGLEAALGLLLIVNVFGRSKWVIKACLLLLAVFSAHLLLLWVREGNDVNCGCMGNVVPMSPGVSLLKNAGLAVVLFILLRYVRAERSPVYHVLSVVVTLLLVALPFFIFPSGTLTMPLSTLYTQQQPELPRQELRRGKHIVCFMSLTCPHCRHAASLMHQMCEENRSLPFYFFFPAQQNDTVQTVELNDFMRETRATGIPYSFITEQSFRDMVKAAGEDGVPVILWMQDTTVVRKVTIPDLSRKEIEAWLSL